MAISEKIQVVVEQLPVSLQAEVLNFVEYLHAKADRLEDSLWSEMSLQSAMRGLETEKTPAYSADDLQVVFE